LTHSVHFEINHQAKGEKKRKAAKRHAARRSSNVSPLLLTGPKTPCQGYGRNSKEKKEKRIKKPLLAEFSSHESEIGG
jgi:hypothetical protein